jgi:hypothetical protein
MLYPVQREVEMILKISLAYISLVAFGILAAACGGDSSSSGSDNGIAIQITGSPVARANLTTVVPGLPRQGNLTPGSIPNLPAGVPSIQVPQVVTGSTTGACALVTRQDAAAVLGKPVNEGKSIDIPKQNLGVITVDISTCSYNVTDAPGQLGIETWKGSDANQVKLMTSVVCQGKERIAGLGDVACWSNADHREIQAIKGLSFINLTVRSAPNETVVRDLAKKVIDKVQ